jgi:hypothetical protein
VSRSRIAIVFRIAPLRAGLPYSDYIDEGHALRQVLDHLNTRSLAATWYGYPTVTSYLVAAMLEMSRPVYGFTHGRSLADDLPRDEQRYLAAGRSTTTSSHRRR